MKGLGYFAGRAVALLAVILIVCFAWGVSIVVLSHILIPEAKAAEINPIASAVRLDTDHTGCSGFYVGDGLIVTAGHCISGTDDLFTIRDAKGQKAGAAKPLVIDHLNDIGILRVVGDLLPSVPAAIVDCSPVSVGTAIFVVGQPGDLPVMIAMYGHVASAPFGAYHWPAIIVTEAQSDHGGSGGPVVDAKTGKIVGVLVGAIPAVENLFTVFVPSTTVCRALGKEAIV